MTSNSTSDSQCAADDTLCRVRDHMQAVIIVPTLLLLGTLITLMFLFIKKYCPETKTTTVTTTVTPSQHYHSHRHNHNNRHSHNNNHRHSHNHSHRHSHSHSHNNNHRQSHRSHLQGIDAPPGLNALEHEELAMSVQQNRRPVLTTVPLVSMETSPGRPVPLVSMETSPGAFSRVSAMTPFFSIKPNDTSSLYRARMDHRDVVLRVLKGSASRAEQQHFVGFWSFLWGVGLHPFLPELLGVVSLQPPLMMVVEELQHRDLLAFLWRSRQEDAGSECHMTEKRIFIMAGQVASALEYLHGQNIIHGNICARSVLIGADLTAKLWGLGSAYRRRPSGVSPGEAEDMERRKWQAPEVLGRADISPSSDVWSFGILLYEMVTLGDPPFAQIMATELLQYLQRGNHLKRPATCSSSLYSTIRACCHWRPQQRLSVSELRRSLQQGERSANQRTVLRVPQPIDFEKYLREAGYGEAYNYAVL